MSKILVATDFSPRSDRALRRAILTARQIAAELVLFHALDDDLPDRLLSMQRTVSTELLTELAETITAGDGISCSYRLAQGDPFRALIDTAREIAPGLIVLGPHWRDLLKDIFVGTTAERTIRESAVPVIMANGVPAGPYQRILIATDFSACSVAATQVAQHLGLLDTADVTVLHVLDTPEKSMMQRSLMSGDEIEDYELAAKAEAADAMHGFLKSTALRPVAQLIAPVELSISETIRREVREARPDLLIVGARGRSGIEKFFLGSVAEEILKLSDVDVLAAPAPEPLKA